jgi:hypothetical protein
MRRILPALFISVSVTTVAGAAQPHMRPGLWEITTTSDLFRLAQISPGGLQNLKDLAEQYGVDISQLPAGEASSQVCVSEETANTRDIPVFYQAELGCSTKNATRNGNRYRFDFVCSSPELNGNGTAEGTFTTQQSFTGRSRFKGTAQGIPVNEQADISGRWVNADCGAIKPM